MSTVVLEVPAVGTPTAGPFDGKVSLTIGQLTTGVLPATLDG